MRKLDVSLVMGKMMMLKSTRLIFSMFLCSQWSHWYLKLELVHIQLLVDVSIKLSNGYVVCYFNNLI